MKKTSVLVATLTILILARAGSSDIGDLYSDLLTLVPPEGAQNNGLTVFPILAFPTGAEQQAMANAYTAVARDSGYFEANAAGSALMENTEAGIYHSNIIADVNLEALTVAYRNGDLGFGSMVKLLHTPFTAYRIMGEQQASAYYLESVLGINVSYAFMRDYYFSGFALGANIKLAYRSIPAILYQHLEGLGSTDQSAVGIMGDLGLLMRFNFLKAYVSRDRNFSVGLSAVNFGPPVLDEPLPSQINGGLSWSPFRFLLLSGEYNLPVNLVNPAKSAQPGFATGLSLQFTDFLQVRAGFQLKGGNPRFSLGTDLDLDGVELGITYTLDYTTQLRIPDHVGLQVRFDLGDEGREDLQKRIDSLYIDALVALSASDYLKVIELCEEALKLDQGFTPARETLKLASKSQELIDKIEAIRLDEASVEEN